MLAKGKGLPRGVYFQSLLIQLHTKAVQGHFEQSFALGCPKATTRRLEIVNDVNILREQMAPVELYRRRHEYVGGPRRNARSRRRTARPFRSLHRLQKPLASPTSNLPLPSPSSTVTANAPDPLNKKAVQDLIASVQ